MDEHDDFQDEQRRLERQPEEPSAGEWHLPAGPGAEERLAAAFVMIDGQPKALPRQSQGEFEFSIEGGEGRDVEPLRRPELEVRLALGVLFEAFGTEEPGLALAERIMDLGDAAGQRTIDGDQEEDDRVVGFSKGPRHGDEGDLRGGWHGLTLRRAEGPHAGAESIAVLAERDLRAFRLENPRRRQEIAVAE